MDAAKAFGANLKAARVNCGWSQERLADEAGVGSKGYISDLEKGQRPMPPGATLAKLAAALGIELAQLVVPGVTEERLVKIVGIVGANPDDSIIYTSADDVDAWAPLPPGGTMKSAALEVRGHSMRWVAEDGALIYFEDQRNPPSENMLGDVVICETAEGQVLVKRLLRGSRSGRYDLESQNGPILEDQRLRWAAEITAIIPPKQARRILRRGEAA
jgi:transcriptional regulator with XRE-family HTH domain